MEKIKILSLFLLFILNYPTFGQGDTLTIKERDEFDEIIYYCFENSVEVLNAEIIDKIQSAFSLYDFSGEEYECSFGLNFFLEFDSCGTIKKCISGKNRTKTNDLDSFKENIVDIILESEWNVKNKFEAIDKTYLFADELVVVSIEIYCDPSEIIFLKRINQGKDRIIMFYESGEGKVYFDGFEHGCNYSSSLFK